MEYTILTSEDFKTSTWPGGTTTELFIFPPASEYQKRNFLFRLSTSSVETESSDFTSLSGVSRKLLVLSGNIVLSHEGHYSKHLGKSDTDEFEGDWKTSSIGRCSDFNLMTTADTTGDLMAIGIKKNQSVNYSLDDNCDFFFIYLYSGKIKIGFSNKPATINCGELLVLMKPSETKLEIAGDENSELVISQISGTELKYQTIKK